jgi:hypothetical protein
MGLSYSAKNVTKKDFGNGILKIRPKKKKTLNLPFP